MQRCKVIQFRRCTRLFLHNVYLCFVIKFTFITFHHNTRVTKWYYWTRLQEAKKNIAQLEAGVIFNVMKNEMEAKEFQSEPW